MSFIPIEAERSIQYMSTWPYPWVQALIFYYWGVHTGYRREHLDERESRDDSLHKVGA